VTARVHRVNPGEPVSLERYTQGAAEVLDYVFEWALLLETDEVVTESTWAITPEGPTLEDDGYEYVEPDPEDEPVEPTTAFTAFVSEGTVGVWYLLTQTITTSADRTYVRSVRIDVVER
jgi:hypothetical protein